MPNPSSTVPTDLPNLQDSVNAELNAPTAPMTVAMPVTPPEPMPKPEPLTELPKTETVTTVETPAVVMPSGDDVPLSFVSPPAPAMTAPTVTTTTTTTTPPPSSVPEPTPSPEPAVVPPVPFAPVDAPKKKSKTGILLTAFALLSMLAVGGFYAYQQYFGAGNTIAPVYVSGNERECTGCKNGYNVHWNSRQGVCVQDDPCVVSGDENTRSACEGRGGYWCTNIVDTRGESHSFCAANDGRACYRQAIDDQGISMSIGSFNGECEKNASGVWALTADSAASYAPYNTDTYRDAAGQTPLQKANELCQKGNGVLDFGTAKYICKVGVKGYTSGACTADNGEPFTGALGCFCGTVQVDTGTGHTSYSSTCGCNEATVTDINPTMSCTGITKSPVTAPVVGDKLTFTCAGVVNPSTAGTLSYKFRSSFNSGVTTALANKTATTAELTMAACGTYKVQCQACATLNGVLTCDPNWTGATQ